MLFKLKTDVKYVKLVKLTEEYTLSSDTEYLGEKVSISNKKHTPEVETLFIKICHNF